MSSRSPSRTGALALLLGLTAMLLPAPAVAAEVPLPVAAVLSGGGQTSLVVDLGAAGRSGRRSVVVTRDGVAERAELIPVMSDGLAVALVVDTSADGARTLPSWLSAAARFILEAPATARCVVISAGAPASVTEPLPGPAAAVRVLDEVRATGGGRDTAAALDLAVRQFPGTEAGRRVVVLYTTGADAGGESAEALGARLRAAGTILVVVGSADTGRFWPDAAAATGGFFAPAADPVVVPALDQVETTLRGRYLVRFPTPPVLPARVSVRIDTAGLRLTGVATVEPPPAAAPASRPTALRWAVIAAGALLVLVAGLLAVRAGRPSPPTGPPALSTVARGRAQVPGQPNGRGAG